MPPNLKNNCNIGRLKFCIFI